MTPTLANNDPGGTAASAGGKINIRDLAKTLKLSPGTISRSLRNHPEIPSVTRDLVIRAAAELGYVPRPWRRRAGGAPNDRRVAARSIGVLVGDGYGLSTLSDGESFLAHYFLSAIHQAAHKANLITPTTFIEKRELSRLVEPAHLPPMLRQTQLDGVILIYPFPEQVVDFLSKRWPCVSIERHDTRGRIDAVGHGQTPAFVEAVSQLYQLGHRSIGFVADVHAAGQRLAINERFAGYLSGLNRFGLSYDSEAVLGMFERIGNEEMVQRVAARTRSGITGWVCALDRQAYVLVRDLPRYKLLVPKDVSVVGFSGIQPMFGLSQVSTYRIPYERIGAAAIETLLTRIAQPGKRTCFVEMPCEFLAGHTSGPPRPRAGRRR